jgi:hypothetical protein
MYVNNVLIKRIGLHLVAPWLLQATGGRLLCSIARQATKVWKQSSASRPIKQEGVY